MSDPVDLPALNFIGYSLDLTSVTPNDIRAVAQAVKRSRQLIELPVDDPIRVITINGVKYNVPKHVLTDTSTKLLQGTYITYKSGVEASSSFLTDVNLSARYMAFSGSASASYSVEKTFRKDEQFALYAFNATLYDAALRNYADLLNEEALVKRIKTLPRPFKSNESTLREYKAFFETFGSHVILNASYGMRFSLTSYVSNENSTINQNFSANVSVAYGGINTGGKFDASIANTEQYKTFFGKQQKLLSVQGGDLKLGLEILNDPTDYKKYVTWTETATVDPDVMNFTLTELWNLMRDATDPVVTGAVRDIQDAFNYIISNPLPYKTGVTLSIESDWAEFGILTPSAVILPDPDNPIPAMTLLNQTRVLWGKEHSHDQRRATIKFFIINDGSLVDFYTSHGSDGGGGGKGRATIIMEGKNYLNDKISDNNWNTMWFWQAAVSTKPAPFPSKRMPRPVPGPPRSPRDDEPHHPRIRWDDVLDEYLRYIKGRTCRINATEADDEEDEV